MRRSLSFALSILVLAGCSSGSGESTTHAEAATHDKAATSTAQATAAAFTSAGGSKELVQALAERMPQVTLTKAYTAEDDENHLLGRPGGYIGKAAFADDRVEKADRVPDKTDVANGGSVEVFSDPAGAQARKTYIDTLLEGSGGMLGSEYSYVSGDALLRVSGNLTPAVADEYAKVWPEVARSVLG